MAKEDPSKNPGSILGDIAPNPGTTDHVSGRPGSEEDEDTAGSRADTSAPGGAGTVTGGTRNFPQRAGATGGDIGNRPE
jgi:hypothetical protein